MNFYFFSHTTDEKGSSVVAPIDKHWGRQFWDLNYISMLDQGLGFNFPALPVYQLKYHGGRFREIMVPEVYSRVMIGSEAFVDLLKKSKTSKFSEAPILIRHRSKVYDHYRMLYFYETRNDLIDFSASKFFIAPPGYSITDTTRERKPISFNTLAEYEAGKKEYSKGIGSIALESLVLRDNHEVDFFS